MTEKNYGGATNYGVSNNSMPKDKSPQNQLSTPKSQSKHTNTSNTNSDNDKIIHAGHIAKQVVEYAKTIVKKDVLLLEIAEKIESKIIELGGKPAFPVNLSINEIAAHATPSFNDTDKAHGLIKVDLGVHIDGFVADTALSIDLENSQINKNLIEAAKAALNAAIKTVKYNISLSELGEAIEKSVIPFKVEIIRNLSGHSLEQYNLHAGLTIPNHNNNQDIQLKEGTYAIEPFTTTGLGAVRDGRMSGIYHLENPNNVRDSFAREVLDFIADTYQTLPFCSRWIYKQFGSRGLLALRRLEEANILHHYPQLIEKNKGIVAQAEHTILITEDKKITVTTQ